MKYKIKANNILVKEIEGNKIFFCGTVGWKKAYYNS